MPVERDVAAMIVNRIIDNAAVAIGAINRHPVVSARDMALGHPRKDAATVFGVAPGKRVSPEWAAWANGTAVRELDMHDTFLAAGLLASRRQHPADPRGGADDGEVRPRPDPRHRHRLRDPHRPRPRDLAAQAQDRPHHPSLPGQAAGIGTLLGLKQDVIYQAVQQAVHVSCTTRQSRKGEISSWKAYAPAHAGKLAVEAVDRVMRGEGAPSPIYEGEDSVIAWLLDGPEAHYQVPLPAPGEPKRAILDSFTKEHSAEYQSQALIDLAFRMRGQIPDLEKIEKIIIHTSHHTHAVIGTGANDPQKMDPKASRETLDHSIMYIFAVALQDGRWHHVDSYTPRRAGRADTVRLWHKIETREDPEWERRYLSTDPAEQAFGGRVEVVMQDGSRIVDELAVANAHPLGARPFGREDYIRKFTALTDGVISTREANRFLEAAQDLPRLKAGELHTLNVALPAGTLAVGKPGIF